MKFIFLLVLFIIGSNVAHAKSKIVEDIGDMLQVFVPAYAIGMTLNEDGWDGTKKFVYSFAATKATVYGLKITTQEPRPNKANNHSFPSGHTASAMSGAAFIHMRYGFQRAIIPYLMTGFTAYSRVASDQHWWWDTVAGAAIAGLISFVIVDRYEGVSVSANPNGVRFNIAF